MTSSAVQTCFISMEIKQQENVFQFSYYTGFLPYLGFQNKKPGALKCTPFSKQVYVPLYWARRWSFDRVTWVTQCKGTRDDNTGCVGSHAAPSSSGAQYRQSEDNFKHYLIICSPDVKHISKLKDVISTTCAKLYIYICGRCAWRSAGLRFRLSSLCMCNSKISPLWGPIVIFGIVKIVWCDNRGCHCFQFISFPLISMCFTV